MRVIIIIIINNSSSSGSGVIYNALLHTVQWRRTIKPE